MSTVKTLLPLRPSDQEIETSYNNRVPEVTRPEAEAGTSTDVKRWTPERVKQAIDALSSGGGGVSLTLDTRNNIIQLTPSGSAVAYATDVERMLVYDGSEWFETNIIFSSRTAPDMGAEENSSLIGYNEDGFSDKTAHNFRILNSTIAQKGSIRTVEETDGVTTAEIMEVFLNGMWNKMPLDIVFIPIDGNYIHVVNTTGIEVMTGNSLNLDVNGLPLIQQYQMPMGALSVPRVVDGNI